MNYSDAVDAIQVVRGSNKRIDLIIEMQASGAIDRTTAGMLVNRFGSHDPMDGADRQAAGDYAN